MSSQPDLPTALIVDSSDSAQELVTLLHNSGFSVRPTHYAQLVSSLPQEKPALIIFSWPQPTLVPQDLRALLASAVDVLGLCVGERAALEPLSADPQLLYCTLRELPAYLALARRLWRQQRQVDQAEAQLYARLASASLGELVGGIAHDLNNPLTAVIGNAELLPEQESEDDQQGVMQIIESARRAQQIAHNLLTIARSRPGQNQWIAGSALVQGTADLCAATLRSQGVQLKLSTAPYLPQLWGENGQLQQALIQLLLLAAQRSRRHNSKTLELHAFAAQPNEVAATPSLIVEISYDAAAAQPEPSPLAPPISADDVLRMRLAREIIARAEGRIDDLATAESTYGYRLTLPLRTPQLFLDDAQDDELPSLRDM